VATLFLMYGYPGSGKSTVARQLTAVNGFRRLSYDELRGRLWSDGDPHEVPGYQGIVIAALDYAAEQLLAAGVPVVYDVNNNQRQQRAAMGVLAERLQARVIVVWVQTPLAVARQRQSNRQLTENHRMTAAKYQHLVDTMEPPVQTETVIKINGQQSIDEQLAAFAQQWSRLI